MRYLVAPVTVLLFGAGCGGGDDGAPTPPPPPEQAVLEGGRYEIDGCGFDVVTRADAEAPAPAPDALGDDPTPFHVHLGFGGDPATTIAMIWRTDDATTSTRVRYGVGDALDGEATGVTFRYARDIGGNGALLRVHEAHLCGLTPDTEYSYQVGGTGDGGVESWSPVYRFRTAPDAAANPDAEVLVGYVGDSRGGYQVWRDVAAQLATRAPDLVVFTGDVVTLGPVQEEWDSFFDAAEDLLATTPIIVAHGNHEINAIHYYAQLAMPGDEENFAFDFGHLHQVVLNSDPENHGDLAGSIRDFLDADLAEADAPWTIVSMHRAMWSSSAKHGSDASLREALGPVIDEHAVDLVISGHDHIFERTKPIRGETIGAGPADGTIYMVSGGAGAPLYEVVSPLPEFSQIAESTYNATVISVRGAMLETESFRLDGSPLDTFTLTQE